ncbi:GIY-YIG nuclease family protein [Thalassoroseus pseudoceratinae]|uniref:GIY-YIG nuclease family protein n=1 Tax=Thalassoroseus pseudoceratinae TaxID=2713176 RepID=UPI001F0FF314|nr:GIY-YIG nuclease family protein [Thalassoroseus pseudoceratinae]
MPDGDPDGLRLVEKSNWTGVGVVFNRSIYKEVAHRPEFDRTGVYVLVGMSEDSALPTIYVGEGDSVKTRLDSHYSKKDFWDWVVFFVTKDSSLNKAHVKHLESRLLALAKEAKQCKLHSEQPSLPPTLSEAETADVESFLLDMLSIFPLLGLGVFEKTVTKKQPNDLLLIESKGIKASGYEDAKGFVVCSGSQLVKDEAATIHNYMSTMRKDLLEQGVTIAQEGCFVFAQDQVFSSPSTAAGVVLGRTANGRIEWKTKDGKTLKQLQGEATESSEED